MTTYYLKRFADAGEYTYGLLYKHGENYPLSFSLEDERREVKVRGETRIPAGRYQIKLRTANSRMNRKYRRKFPWFKGHLWLQNVPGFSYIYIHIGNTDKDTEGCILMAATCDLTPPTVKGFIGESTPTYKKVYLEILAKLEVGEVVFFEIIDHL